MKFRSNKPKTIASFRLKLNCRGLSQLDRRVRNALRSKCSSTGVCLSSGGGCGTSSCEWSLIIWCCSRVKGCWLSNNKNIVNRTWWQNNQRIRGTISYNNNNKRVLFQKNFIIPFPCLKTWMILQVWCPNHELCHPLILQPIETIQCKSKKKHIALVFVTNTVHHIQLGLFVYQKGIHLIK